MKISELVEKLKELKEVHGDLDVEFQHCDDGGTYSGSEEISGVKIANHDWHDVHDGLLVSDDSFVLLF